MAKVNDLQCVGDALFQSDVKVNGKLNNVIFDIASNVEVHFFAKFLDCTTVGNKVTLYNVPNGYYGVCFEAPYVPSGPLNLYGIHNGSGADITNASIVINSHYEGSAHTSSTCTVPNNGGSTISFTSSMLEAGPVEAEVTSAGNYAHKAYLTGIYMLIPTT